MIPAIDPDGFQAGKGNIGVPAGTARPGAISSDPAPIRARPRAAAGKPAVEAPAPVLPPWPSITIGDLDNFTVAPTAPVAADAPETVPASLDECKMHRDLELFYAKEAGIEPPPRGQVGITDPTSPPRPTAEPGPVKAVKIRMKSYQSDSKRTYAQGHVVELPSAEADALIAAGLAELQPGKVWVACLLETGVLIGDPPQLLTRARPIKVAYEVAMAWKNPKPTSSPLDPRRLALSSDAVFRSSATAIISDDDAKNWDPEKLKRPDPRPPIGRHVKDPSDALPKVKVRVTAGGFVGRYATPGTGSTIEMDEESAVLHSVMRFPDTQPYCHANHFDGKAHVTILEEVSREGQEYRDRLVSFARANRGVIHPAMANFPAYPGLEKERMAS